MKLVDRTLATIHSFPQSKDIFSLLGIILNCFLSLMSQQERSGLDEGSGNQKPVKVVHLVAILVQLSNNWHLKKKGNFLVWK